MIDWLIVKVCEFFFFSRKVLLPVLFYFMFFLFEMDNSLVCVWGGVGACVWASLRTWRLPQKVVCHLSSPDEQFTANNRIILSELAKSFCSVFVHLSLFLCHFYLRGGRGATYTSLSHPVFAFLRRTFIKVVFYTFVFRLWIFFFSGGKGGFSRCFSLSLSKHSVTFSYFNTLFLSPYLSLSVFPHLKPIVID